MSRPSDATTKIWVICNQRPLTLAPTVGNKKGNKIAVFVRPNDTVGGLKAAIQAQLTRGSRLNHELLSPDRQVLYDPDEGFELQDQMPHGFPSGQELKLALKRVELPKAEGPPPWDKAFVRARSLTMRAHPHPNRTIRDAKHEISVFRTGGHPEIKSSFAARESALLQEWAENAIQEMSVPQKEWHHKDRLNTLSLSRER